MNKQFPVRGVRELDRFLAAFPKKLETGAYRAALTAAAAVIRDEARMRAPKESGELARGIKSGSPRKNEDGTFSVSVRLTGKEAFVGVFMEYGVAPHFITAGDSGLSSRLLTRKGKRGIDIAARKGKEGPEVLSIGGRYVSGAVHHPGHVARPFMRPALDLKADEAVHAFAGRIRAFIEQKSGYAAPTDEAA